MAARQPTANGTLGSTTHLYKTIFNHRVQHS